MCREFYFPVLTNPSIYQSSVKNRAFLFMNRYYIIYKPYQVLSQFSAVDGKQTLADFFQVPKDVYPVGRLDFDSEGLLILTNNTALNSRLLHPKNKHKRTYWVQVEGEITTAAISMLSCGVEISIDGKSHRTQPAMALSIEAPEALPQRNPPIRFRKNVTTSWIALTLIEGKNRQVRKMTAKVGYPTLRLIRCSIEKLSIKNMQPGDMIELNEQQILKALFQLYLLVSFIL